MTNQIVLANPIATAVQPKPTKKEVVDAMVQLKVQENQKLNNEADQKRLKLRKQIDAKAIRYAIRNQSKTRSSVSIYNWNSEVRVELTIKDLPDDLKVLLEEYKTIDGSLCTDEKRIRKMITESINGHLTSSDRVQALINSPEAKKALQAMLTEIGV